MSEGITMDIYEPVISELRAQIEEWQRMIVNLEMMRSKGIASPPPTSPVAASAMQGAGVLFSNDAFFGMTIGDGAKKYLATTKKTAPARVIADALLAGGFKTSAKNFLENVRSILSRHPHIVSVNGEYGLAEWYPGRKSATKKSGAAAQAAQPSEDISQDVSLDEVLRGVVPIGLRLPA